MHELTILTPGQVPYEEAWELQKSLHAQRVAGEIPDTLVLLTHPHVLTVGRRSGKEDLWANLTVQRQQLEAQGVDLVESDRGGDITYHGPGQLVGYPIIDLARDQGSDVRRYVRNLEALMMLTLRAVGVDSERDPDNPGVWIDGNKIGAIGARIRKWVTMHGFALNVRGELEGFNWIVACGIQGRGVTSLERQLPSIPSDEGLVELVADAAGAVFHRSPVFRLP